MTMRLQAPWALATLLLLVLAPSSLAAPVLPVAVPTDTIAANYKGQLTVTDPLGGSHTAKSCSVPPAITVPTGTSAYGTWTFHLHIRACGAFGPYGTYRVSGQLGFASFSSPLVDCFALSGVWDVSSVWGTISVGQEGITAKVSRCQGVETQPGDLVWANYYGRLDVTAPGMVSPGNAVTSCQSVPFEPLWAWVPAVGTWDFVLDLRACGANGPSSSYRFGATIGGVSAETSWNPCTSPVIIWGRIVVSSMGPVSMSVDGCSQFVTRPGDHISSVSGDWSAQKLKATSPSGEVMDYSCIYDSVPVYSRAPVGTWQVEWTHTAPCGGNGYPPPTPGPDGWLGFEAKINGITAWSNALWCTAPTTALGTITLGPDGSTVTAKLTACS